MVKSCADCAHFGPFEGGYAYCFARPPVIDTGRLQRRAEKGDNFISASYQASVLPVVEPGQRQCGEFVPAKAPVPPRRSFRVILRARAADPANDPPRDGPAR